MKISEKKQKRKIAPKSEIKIIFTVDWVKTQSILFQIAEQNREIERLTEEKEQLSRILGQHSNYPDQSSSFFSVVGDVNNDRLSTGRGILFFTILIVVYLIYEIRQ